ncbi:MAG TPA: hypothetical protein EYP21_02745 [Syntrophaceae bacterium]|nr:hypothetical protein [Syntrophaceae bacterium]
MDWRPWFPEVLVGGKTVSVRSLRLPDESTLWRRYRVCTVEDSFRPKFTSRPASGRLAKDPSGKIGALITGLYSGWVKVGRQLQTQPYLFVPLNALSKKVQKSLLRQIDYELFEEDGVILARERS